MVQVMRMLIVMPASERHRLVEERLRAAGHECACVTADQLAGLAAAPASFDVVVWDCAGPGARPPAALPWAALDRTAVVVSGAELDAAEGGERLPGLLHELAAALAAVARTADLLTWQDLVLEPAGCRATRSGIDLRLTQTEYRVLECLVRYAGTVVTRRMLCDHVWSQDWHGLTNVVDVYVSRVRRKVDQGFTPRLVQTVRGIGYRLGGLP
jgi:two-component system OmpR family response regulator